ncbi:MAG TPA: two pore domain potassium channel family protein [Rhodanobacteraceae bacterium]
MGNTPTVAGGWRQQARLYLHPSALLLLVQLLEIVLYPATRDTPAGRALLGIVGAAVLLLALRLIHHTQGLVWHAALLAVAAIVLNIAWAVFGGTSLQAWQAGLEALLYFYTARCLIGYMLADRRATRDELFAAAATFTLLVWAFTELLVLCQLLQPAAFTGAGAPGDPRSWSELIFLSFAMFTNTGIGTTVPMSAASRAIGDIEMFSGVMYLALVVSRLVGLVTATGARKQR